MEAFFSLLIISCMKLLFFYEDCPCGLSHFHRGSSHGQLSIEIFMQHSKHLSHFECMLLVRNHLNNALSRGGRHTTEVVFVLLTQLSRFNARRSQIFFLWKFLSLLLSFIDGNHRLVLSGQCRA